MCYKNPYYFCLCMYTGRFSEDPNAPREALIMPRLIDTVDNYDADDS